MTFVIHPYRSIGVLNWSMQTHDVDAALGPSSRVSKNRQGNSTQYREQFSQACIFDKRSGLLVEVTFSERRELVFLGKLDLIAASNVEAIRTLYQLDPTALKGFGAIVFPELGVSLTGYEPNDEQIKAVSAFSRGRWDTAMRNMKPLRS